MPVCFESILPHYFCIFQMLKKHMATLMNRTHCWWCICHCESLEVMDVCVCESMIYGAWDSVRLGVWVSTCEKNNSLLKWPWERLEEVLEHKITVETVSDELCVYVSISASVLCRARSYAGWHCALIVVITHDAIVGKRNSCLGN